MHESIINEKKSGSSFHYKLFKWTLPYNLSGREYNIINIVSIHGHSKLQMHHRIWLQFEKDLGVGAWFLLV